MYRILIVEDDQALAGVLRSQMESWGYDVKVAENLSDILPEFREYQPHLVIMDITLPFYNGCHWCMKIREISSVPVVFLSSASENMNIIMAIHAGGDEFIAKPVDPSVLIAKAGAVLRRTYEMNGYGNVLEHRGAVLNLNDSTLVYNEKVIELTKNEFRILRTLLENKGKIVSRDALMIRLWQDDCYVEENTLTVNVTRLRRKLESAGLSGFITTRVGNGYIIEG